MSSYSRICTILLLINENLVKSGCFYMLESPLTTQNIYRDTDMYKMKFNWTATCRHDSDIVTPYGKFVPYNPNVKFLPLKLNYALNKTRKVAWFVSNCWAHNERLAYAQELARFIPVDIYGMCGHKECQRNEMAKCMKMLDKDYKFYLAFENSYCEDYITEKLYDIGLKRNIVPIVLGARKEDYIRSAPPQSFISVEDFNSSKSLAEYLHHLDKNDKLFNEFFRWKGTGEFVNTYFWCRLCALLHDKRTYKYKYYEDIENWWNGPNTCSQTRWSQQNISSNIVEKPGKKMKTNRFDLLSFIFKLRVKFRQNFYFIL
uniref:Fucosyltransferase n=1 Tax=Strigamia maritima TaxID=126957 RepID=T1JFI9_STRMM